MKLRWILLAALIHFAITTMAVLVWLPCLISSSAGSQDFERQMRILEFASSALIFPVGLIEYGGLPFAPMVLNSLFLGWAIMGGVALIRKRRGPSPTEVPASTDETTARVRPFLIQTLVLAVFCFAMSPVAAGSAVTLFVLLLLVSIIIRSVVRKMARKKGWTAQRQATCVWKGTLAVLVVVALLTITPWPSVFSGRMSRANEMSFGERVASLKQMQARRIPFHLMMLGSIRWRTDFNVNRCFSVLDRLAPQQGYTLDYVYACNRLGGSPVLYARRQWAVPFLTYSAYRNAGPETGADGQPSFLLHVEADGTPQGFIQLVVLHIMADQFYLFWHAHYNDERIVYDRGQLDALLVKQDIFKKPTAEERQRASSLDLQPSVELQTDTARVSMFTWTDWGGLYRKTFTISRKFPHRILKTEDENIVSYFCGIVF